MADTNIPLIFGYTAATNTSIKEIPTGTGIPPTAGGTGVANGSNNTVTFTGNYTLAITLSANTAITFPTTGTLATLAGSESFSNKTLTNPVVTNYVETYYAATITGNAVTINLVNGTMQKIAPAASATTTITLPTATAGKSFTLITVQAGSSTVLSFTGSLKWAGGVQPSVTQTNGKNDKYVFTCWDGTYWEGSDAGRNY